MKVGVVADSHFDEHSRFEECKRLHAWIAQDMAERGVSVVVHTGDVYERKSTPLERQAVADWVGQVASFAPMLIVRGNHDAVDDLPLLQRLETAHPVIVEQEAGVHTIAGLNIAALSWPRKAALLAASAAEGKEVGEAVAGDALRAVLRGLGQRLASLNGPRLFAAHAMVQGSITSTGQPLVGCDLELGLEDIELARADAYALGHIHKGQRWDLPSGPVVYPGSPRRTAFGELEPKGYTLLEWDDELGAVRDTFIEAPATEMIQVEAKWTDGGFSGDYQVGAEHEGAEVRFRYRVAGDQRDAARSAAAAWKEELLAFGVASVKLEEVVIAETRARAPEIAQAATLDAKLDAFWAAKGFAPGARREALLAKAHELEEASHAA